MSEKIYTEKLFSYGTLQYESVQLATFGRKLNGKKDLLLGFNLSMVEITDKSVIEKSGDASHPIVNFTGNKTDQISGIVLDAWSSLDN